MSTASTAAVGGSVERYAAWAATFASTALVVLLVTPRASPGSLGLLALAMGAATGFAVGFRELLRLPLAAALVAALGAWGLVSLGWAADQKEALGKSAMLIGFTLATVSVQTLTRHVDAVVLRRVAGAMLVTFAVGVFYLIVEELTDHLLKRTFFRVVPFATPIGKMVTHPEGEISLAGYISNRSMAAMVLALWPMLLIAMVLADDFRQRLAAIGVVALALVAMAMSVHETSFLAVVAGAGVFAICFVRPKVGLGVVAAGWLVATLLVVPLASWASSGAQLHKATWLPNSARHRIVLWAYTAEQVWQRPLTGVGAASTKLIDARRGPRVAPLQGTTYEWRSGPHAHNVFLQTWYEMGAVGAGLLCAAGLALIGALSRLPVPVQPYAAAAVTTAAAVGAFSWGMWQAWFLGVFMVTAVLMSIAVQVARHDGEAVGAGTS